MTTLPHRLAEPTLRRNVAAVLRRKVAADEVDDLTQTALCEALECESLPEAPDELRRFVVAIARHKAVDHHRRKGRALVVTGAGEGAPEPVAPSIGDEVEARALLKRIVDAASNDHREAETLDWLVREHDGEALAEIAASEKVEAPAVRQRVSRLRRLLKSRWASVLAVLVVVGGAGVAASRTQARNAEAILVDPATDPVTHAIGTAQGTWRVTAMRRTDGKAEIDGLTLRVDGHRVDVTGPLGPVGRVSGTIGKLQPGGDGSFAFRFVDDRGDAYEGVARVRGRTMTLELTAGRVRGVAQAARE